MQFISSGHQNYEWGSHSQSSLIYKIQQSHPELAPLDSSAKYAELWLGTHPNLPSHLEKKPTKSLLEHIVQYPESLGDTMKVFEKNQGLPFLMKVLSVEKSLSIQAHPDVELAKFLNNINPMIYKDANHKPEIAIALTSFQAFCNFAPAKNICENLMNYEEFKNLFHEEILYNFLNSQNKENLKALVAELFKLPVEQVKESMEKMVKRLKNKIKLDEREVVILRLHEQFPYDIGIFFSLFMNLIVLRPGMCLEMKPNEPHAYLHGECIECMANSDNVVRAGLTPKLKDIETLTKMLSYNMTEPQLLIPLKYKSTENDGYECLIYRSEFKEFQCIQIEMEKNVETEAFFSLFPFVGIILEGSGKLIMEENTVEILQFQQFFIPAKLKFSFVNKNNLKIYLCGSWQ